MLTTPNSLSGKSTAYLQESGRCSGFFLGRRVVIFFLSDYLGGFGINLSPEHLKKVTKIYLVMPHLLDLAEYACTEIFSFGPVHACPVHSVLMRLSSSYPHTQVNVACVLLMHSKLAACWYVLHLAVLHHISWNPS